MFEKAKKFVKTHSGAVVKTGMAVVGAVIGITVLVVVGKLQEEADFNDELITNLSDAVIGEPPAEK